MKLKYFAIALALLAIGACKPENKNNENEANLGDQPIAKAAALAENTYVVQKVGGEAQTHNFTQSWSQWERMPMTNPETDETSMYVNFSLEEYDEELATIGGGFAVLPEEAIGEVQTIDSNFVWKHPDFSANAFALKNPKQGFKAGEVNAKVGSMGNGKVGGNMKLGKCQIYVKTYSTKTDPYSGLYQFMFYYEFTNHIYQFSESTLEEEEIKDGDYIIYGNAIVEEYFPPVRSFTLKPHTFHLNYGMTNGQELEVDYTPTNAKWDWNDLEIYQNDDFFKWYPESHRVAINQLASGADHQVKGVQIMFRLKSNHSVYDDVYVDLN